MVSMVEFIPRTMDGRLAVTWPVKVLSSLCKGPLNYLNPNRLQYGTQAKWCWGFEILELILASGGVYRILPYGS